MDVGLRQAEQGRDRRAGAGRRVDQPAEEVVQWLLCGLYRESHKREAG
jgi:hypothetical protein